MKLVLVLFLTCFTLRVGWCDEAEAGGDGAAAAQPAGAVETNAQDGAQAAEAAEPDPALEALKEKLREKLLKLIARQKKVVQRLDARCRKLEKPLRLPLPAKPSAFGRGAAARMKRYQEQLQKREQKQGERRQQLAEVRVELKAARAAQAGLRQDYAALKEIDAEQLEELLKKHGMSEALEATKRKQN